LWQHRKAAARDAERRAKLFDGAGSLSESGGDAAGREATVSIIVPALNEEAGLEATLRYLQQQLQPAAAEIIVVDGGSSDRTVSVARRCGVRVVHAGRGRARQMNAGAAAAKGATALSAALARLSASSSRRTPAGVIVVRPVKSGPQCCFANSRTIPETRNLRLVLQGRSSSLHMQTPSHHRPW
jgi:hypothetical protein